MMGFDSTDEKKIESKTKWLGIKFDYQKLTITVAFDRKTNDVEQLESQLAQLKFPVREKRSHPFHRTPLVTIESNHLIFHSVDSPLFLKAVYLIIITTRPDFQGCDIRKIRDDLIEASGGSLNLHRQMLRHNYHLMDEIADLVDFQITQPRNGAIANTTRYLGFKDIFPPSIQADVCLYLGEELVKRQEFQLATSIFDLAIRLFEFQLPVLKSQQEPCQEDEYYRQVHLYAKALLGNAQAIMSYGGDRRMIIALLGKVKFLPTPEWVETDQRDPDDLLYLSQQYLKQCQTLISELKETAMATLANILRQPSSTAMTGGFFAQERPKVNDVTPSLSSHDPSSQPQR